MENNSNTFYFLIGTSIAAFVGGAYMIYKNFNSDIESELEIKNNKEEPSNSSNNVINIRKEILNHKNKLSITPLTKEKATQIYAEMTKALEEFSEIYDSSEAKNERRKALMQGEQAWIPLVSQLLSKKHFYFEEQKKKTLDKYNVKMNEFDYMITNSILFSDVEIELFKIYKPNINYLEFPTKPRVKEAYIYHCEKMYETLTKSEQINSNFSHPEEKTYFMLIERVRIDDDLFFKYGFTFNQMKWLINHYDLYSDEEVQSWYSIIPS